jgi:hypothetical protein
MAKLLSTSSETFRPDVGFTQAGLYPNSGGAKDRVPYMCSIPFRYGPCLKQIQEGNSDFAWLAQFEFLNKLIISIRRKIYFLVSGHRPIQ